MLYDHVLVIPSEVEESLNEVGAIDLNRPGGSGEPSLPEVELWRGFR
jgi:hypothetical protein